MFGFSFYQNFQNKKFLFIFSWDIKKMVKALRKKWQPKKTVKKAVAKARRQPLVKLVKRIIKRQAETKISVFQDGFDIGPGTIDANNIQPLTPYNAVGLDISQGDGQADRQGNRITVKSAVMRYTIYPAPYAATTNDTPRPQVVRMWFFSQKSSNTLLVTNPPQFIQTGNSSGTLSGTLLDLNRVLNNDEYTYLGHRTFKLGYSSYNGTGPSAANEYFNNNDFKFFHQGTINLTKWFPKIIKYNDTDDNPNSKLVMMLIQTVHADGSSADPDDKTVLYNYEITLKYMDF